MPDLQHTPHHRWFHTWLLAQTGRRDRVGVLAREFSDVVDSWKTGNQEALRRWRKTLCREALESLSTREATALEQAEREWDIAQFGPLGSAERRRNLIAMFQAAEESDKFSRGGLR